MNIKLSIAALIVGLAPTFALAQGCNSSDHSQQAAMSCAEGMTIDVETNTCVPIVTG